MCKQHLISLGVQCSLVLHVKGPRITEALTLLQMNMDACKASAVACSFFYDELAVPVESSILHASIIEWIAVQTEDFSTLYLGDLEGGQLQSEVEDSAVLQGEPWMNLDGNLSAIILNVLPLLIAFPNHRHVKSKLQYLSLASLDQK
jgi:hypothetical protein